MRTLTELVFLALGLLFIGIPMLTLLLCLLFAPIELAANLIQGLT